MGVFRDQIAAIVVKCPHAIESATGCCYVEGSQAYKRIDTTLLLLLQVRQSLILAVQLESIVVSGFFCPKSKCNS